MEQTKELLGSTGNSSDRSSLFEVLDLDQFASVGIDSETVETLDLDTNKIARMQSPGFDCVPDSGGERSGNANWKLVMLGVMMYVTVDLRLAIVVMMLWFRDK